MIFFDFDGTIVDVWPRYHQVFLTASKIFGIPFSLYRDTKQALISDRSVANHLGIKLPSEYFEQKRSLLEAEEFLRLDTLLLPSEELLSFFSQYDCRILTNRRRITAFEKEMENLGLRDLTEKAIILNPESKIRKKRFIEENFPQGFHIIVGDSEAEWEAADLKNVYAILVQTGLRRPENFPTGERCVIMPSIRCFISDCKKQIIKNVPLTFMSQTGMNKI